LPNGSTSRQQPRAAATWGVAHGEPDEVGSNDVGDTEDVGSDEVAADDDVGPDDEWPALQPTVTSTSNEAAPLRALRIPMPHLLGRGRRLLYTGDGDVVPRHPCWRGLVGLMLVLAAVAAFECERGLSVGARMTTAPEEGMRAQLRARGETGHASVSEYPSRSG
jgi:hypothetical protein